MAGRSAASATGSARRREISNALGIKRTADRTNITATVAASSNLENQCPTKVPLKAKNVGTGMASALKDRVLQRDALFAVHLTPGDDHGPRESDDQAEGEYERRDGNRFSRDDERDKRGPERREVEDRSDDDGMSVAESIIVRQQSGHADDEQDQQSS
jgi:hypothetical protein